MSAKLKAKRAALLVEVGDSLHQVILSDSQTKQLLYLVAALHGGAIEVMETPVESITFTAPHPKRESV